MVTIFVLRLSRSNTDSIDIDRPSANLQRKDVDVMSRTVSIDTEECIGCESCVEVCPEVFGFNPTDEKAFVIDTDIEDEESVDEAIEIWV